MTDAVVCCTWFIAMICWRVLSDVKPPVLVPHRAGHLPVQGAALAHLCTCVQDWQECLRWLDIDAVILRGRCAKALCVMVVSVCDGAVVSAKLTSQKLHFYPRLLTR